MKELNVEKDERLVIGYVRESTMEQAVDGFNLEGQQKKIRQYCETFDLGEPTFLIEKGKSGKSLNRTKAKELVKLVKNDKVKIVIVQKLDRLTRNIADLSELMKLFQNHDVTLISMYEKFDTTTANGMFAAKLFILLAEQELDQISERTKWGLQESAAQGNYVIGGKVAKGYKRVDGKLQIKEEEVPIIKEIFERTANGEASLPIAMDLFARQVLGIKWNENSVIAVVRNTLYKGVWIYNNQEIAVPSIVSTELWEKANLMASTRKKAERYTYLFSYLMRCKECNNVLRHESAAKGKGYYYYYRCTNCYRRINENLVLKACKKEIVAKLVKEQNKILLTYNNRISTNVRRINKLEDSMLVYGESEEGLARIEEFKKLNEIYREKYNQIKTQGISFDELDKDILASWMVNTIDKILYDFNKKSAEIIWKKVQPKKEKKKDKKNDK